MGFLYKYAILLQEVINICINYTYTISATAWVQPALTITARAPPGNATLLSGSKREHKINPQPLSRVAFPGIYPQLPAATRSTCTISTTAVSKPPPALTTTARAPPRERHSPEWLEA